MYQYVVPLKNDAISTFSYTSANHKLHANEENTSMQIIGL
jgi:hypothetical protein